MTPQELCLKAAEIIETRGWCQDIAEDNDGRVCLVAALVIANGGTAFDSGLAGFDRVLHFVHEQFGGTLSYNDAKGRTQAEVVAKLREVAGT